MSISSISSIKRCLACLILASLFIGLGIGCYFTVVKQIQQQSIKLLPLTYKDSYKEIKEVTAYSARISETDSTPLITASGQKVREGIIAVSRDLYSNGWTFGKKVIISGMGVFEIQDKMGRTRRKGKKRVIQTKSLDIFMGNTDKAIIFGRQRLIVKLIK